MSTPDVLVVTKDKRMMGTIQSMLVPRCAGKSPFGCRTLVELQDRLPMPSTNGGIGVAVIDIDQDPDRILFDLGRVIAANPKTRFVVLSTDSSEELILQAMQAGARHFLRKGNIATELDNVLERLLSHELPPTVRLGDVISVFSCSGGCGATTVAVNLASELRLLCSQPVLIIDLDQHYGSVASHLGIYGRYGIAHILSRGEAIDSHLIQTGATTFAKGLDVLLSPVVASEDMSLPMQWENLGKAIEACREPYRYIIIDAPRLSQHAVDLAALSQTIVVVFQLSVRDISFAKSTIALLRSRGVALHRILPLANRVNRRGPLLRLEDGKDAIGMKSVCSIRSDWRKVIKSVNQGQPLASVARRSRLRRDFHRLALKIHQGT